MNTRSAPVWDLPTRLFHWSLPPLLVASWASAEFDRLEIHQWCGYTMLTLIAFRIVWGFVGSTHARFASFLRGPRAVIDYWRNKGPLPEGHNPAGGWSVMLMLILLLAQGTTGLFNEDDVAFSGPLVHTVSDSLAGKLGAWHETNFQILLALIVLHVGTVLLYLRRGQNLLGPMIDGGKSGQGARVTASWIALLILAACAGLLWFLLSLAPKPAIFM
ncbi:MAG: cytochrome b/b6 domain-containing protein [Gammaproteobacteria bacterium]|nr:cytochrome b/b6 domain-containing protein [Gammaproteobacteria bacterium]